MRRDDGNRPTRISSAACRPMALSRCATPPVPGISGRWSKAPGWGLSRPTPRRWAPILFPWISRRSRSMTSGWPITPMPSGSPASAAPSNGWCNVTIRAASPGSGKSSSIPSALPNFTRAGRSLAALRICSSRPDPSPGSPAALSRRASSDNTAAKPRAKGEMGMIRFWMAFSMLAGLCGPALAEDVQSRDRTVTVTSTVPAIAGKKSTLYLRERALPQVMRDGAGDKVVLFVHGAGTPAEVSFDVPYQDYSWMGYLAKAGYDVFSVDMTGYGRSARPKQMGDKCNLSPEQQKSFGVSCPASYPGNL